MLVKPDEFVPEETPIKIVCFFDHSDMEFIMPDKEEQEYIRFICPTCKLMYLIPREKLGLKVKIRAELQP